MKVVMYVADQNPARDRSLGITGYSDGLIRALLARGEVEVTALGSRTSYSPPLPDGQRYRLPLRTDAAFGRLIADNLHPFFSRTAADLWHYPKGHLPLAMRPRKPVVGTVHDLIAQYCADHYPHARSGLAYTYWSGVLKRSIPRFDAIVTISEFSANAIREFCDRFRLRCPPIQITYEGSSLEGRGVTARSKENKVVHLASQEVHKRTSTVLEYWRTLQSMQKELPRLQLIGSLSADDRKLAEGLSVEICGRLPRGELEGEIAGARALLFFSEIEGFGLPALEAYLLGTPVVYVKATAVEEILGFGTTGGFNLDSFESFRAAFEDALQMEGSAVAEKARELQQRFTWNDCAEHTVAVYRSLV